MSSTYICDWVVGRLCGIVVQTQIDGKTKNKKKKKHRIEKWQNEESIITLNWSETNRKQQKKRLFVCDLHNANIWYVVPCTVGRVHMINETALKKEPMHFGKRQRVNIKCLSTLHLALNMPSTDNHSNQLKIPWKTHEGNTPHFEQQQDPLFPLCVQLHLKPNIYSLIIFPKLHCLLLSHVFHFLFLLFSFHLFPFIYTMCVPANFWYYDSVCVFVFHVFSGKHRNKYAQNKLNITCISHAVQAFQWKTKIPNEKKKTTNRSYFPYLWYSLMLWDFFFSLSLSFRFFWECIQRFRSLSLNLNTSLKEMFENKQKKKNQNIMSNRCRWSDIKSEFFFFFLILVPFNELITVSSGEKCSRNEWCDQARDLNHKAGNQECTHAVCKFVFCCWLLFLFFFRLKIIKRPLHTHTHTHETVCRLFIASINVGFKTAWMRTYKAHSSMHEPKHPQTDLNRYLSFDATDFIHCWCVNC